MTNAIKAELASYLRSKAHMMEDANEPEVAHDLLEAAEEIINTQ